MNQALQSQESVHSHEQNLTVAQCSHDLDQALEEGEQSNITQGLIVGHASLDLDQALPEV